MTGRACAASRRVPGVRWVDALRLLRLGRIERRFADLLDPDAPERGARLDDRSLADFARLYFGRSALSHWAEPFTADLALCDAEETSRLLFLRLHTQRRFAWLGVPRVGLGVLAEALAEGLDVRRGARVEAVTGTAGGRLRVDVSGAPSLAADAVVLATDPGAALRLAPDLLAPAERDVLGASRYAPALVLHVALAGPLFPILARVRVPASEMLPFQTLFHEPGAPGARVPEGAGALSLVARTAWSRAHQDLADEAIAKELLAAAARVHPGVESTVRFSHLERTREAVPLFPVGRYRALASLRRVGADLRERGRRLYFAGDWLADPTLEGAARSGLRAASELSADFSGST
jgi:oxygen-dependent protoporphyrinogen oxidase